MRKLDHPLRDELTLDTVLAALADPMRRMIVHKLADRSHDLACIAIELPVAKSTASHHFRVLREAGVIRQTYNATAIMNALREEDLAARFPGLLKAVLDAERDATPGSGREVDAAGG